MTPRTHLGMLAPLSCSCPSTFALGLMIYPRLMFDPPCSDGTRGALCPIFTTKWFRAVCNLARSSGLLLWGEKPRVAAWGCSRGEVRSTPRSRERSEMKAPLPPLTALLNEAVFPARPLCPRVTSRGGQGRGVWAQGTHTWPWWLPGLSKRLCLWDAARWGSGDGGGAGEERLGASLGPFQGQREPKLGHCSLTHPCMIPCQRHQQLQWRPAAFGTQPGHGRDVWPALQPAAGAGSPPQDRGCSVWTLQESLWKRHAGLGLIWSCVWGISLPPRCWEFGATSGHPTAPARRQGHGAVSGFWLQRFPWPGRAQCLIVGGGAGEPHAQAGG